MGVNASRVPFCFSSQCSAIIYKPDISILAPFLSISDPSTFPSPAAKGLASDFTEGIEAIRQEFKFSAPKPSHLPERWPSSSASCCCNEEVCSGQLPLVFSKFCPVTFYPILTHPFYWLLPGSIWMGQVSSTLNQLFFTTGPSFSSHLHTQIYPLHFSIFPSLLSFLHPEFHLDRAMEIILINNTNYPLQ